MSSYSEYVSRGRNAAARAGRPKLRMRGPAVPLRVSTDHQGGSNVLFVYLGLDDKLMGVTGSDLKAGVRTPLGDVSRVADALTDPGAMVVVPDAGVARRLIRRVELAGSDHRATRRRINYALKAAASSRVVTLTTALSRKFFLPIDQDARAIGAWCRTFNLPGPTAGIEPSLLALLHKAISGEPSSRLSSLALDSLVKCEQEAFDSLYYSGARSASTAFRASGRIQDAWVCIEKTDAILRSRFLADGSVVTATPLRRNGAVECLLSTPVQLKQGEKVLVGHDSPSGFDADGRAKLVRLEITDDGMVGAFEPVKGRSGKDFGMFDMALADHARLLVTAEPFLGMRLPRPSGTWFAREPEPLGSVRDTPLDVALAGVPVAD